MIKLKKFENEEGKNNYLPTDIIVQYVEENELSYFNNDFAILTLESNKQLMEICYNQGWSENENYMLKSEAENVTDIGTTFSHYNNPLSSNTYYEVSFNELKYFKNINTIDNEAFYSWNGLTEITIPNSVTSIDRGAFSMCTSLTSITIPNSVTSIGSGAFNGCTNLTSITIPDSVTSIGSSTFSSCSRLTSITIPNSVTSIGNYAFSICYFTKDNFINNSNLDAEANNYWGATIVDEITEDGLYILNNEIVQIKENITNVTIPNSITSIGASTFINCTSLTSVTIPNSVTSIGSYAFNGCTNLTSITIPDSVTSIGNQAFYDCLIHKDNFINNSTLDAEAKNYWGAKVYDTLTDDGLYIKDNAVIYYKKTLTNKITIPSVITSITSTNMFNSVLIHKDNFINNSTLNAEAKNYWGAKVYDTLTDDGLYIKDTTFVEVKDDATDITIPEYITKFNNEVLMNNSNITSVICNCNVVSLGYGAFYQFNSLTSIKLPNNLTTLGMYSFYGCLNLKTIELPSTMTNIGDYTFGYCHDLKTITCYATTAPTLSSFSFYKFTTTNGTLRVPQGSDYSTWLTKLGNGWKIEYIN